MNAKQVWNLCKAAATSWIDDFAPSMGAALAYYTLFSVAPLLLIVISVAGLVFGRDAAHGEIFAQLQGLMGNDAAKAVEGLIASVSSPSKGILSMLIGVAVALIGATTVFAELQDALDRIWRAPARKTSGVWGLLRARVLSFGLILGVGFLLIASLVVSAGLSALGKWWAPIFGGWEVLAQVVNFAVSFGLVTVVFAMIYKIMPRVHIQWQDVWIGAGVTALLFTVGKFAIGLYIGRSGVASGFGAAASLVVLLLWVYYSAQIFLLGAEFTWVYAHTFGSLKGRTLPGAAPPIPSISGEAAPADAGASGAPAPAIVAAATGQGASVVPVFERPAVPTRRTVPATPDPLMRIGYALAVGVALRFVLPLALRSAVRRLSRRSRA